MNRTYFYNIKRDIYFLSSRVTNSKSSLIKVLYISPLNLVLLDCLCEPLKPVPYFLLVLYSYSDMYNWFRPNLMNWLYLLLLLEPGL